MAKNNGEMVKSLNELVATHGVFYIKLHQYHWYVKGPHFFTLHEQFEELYVDTGERLDAFAERLISINEKPYSTLEEYIEHSVVKEKRYGEDIDAETMVKNLIDDFKSIKDLALKIIEQSGECDDHVTEDMLVEYVESIDETTWMLSAFLGK